MSQKLYQRFVTLFETFQALYWVITFDFFVA